MVRPLRQSHLRVWLVLGPLLLVSAGAVLLTRGPRPIPTPDQAASMAADVPPVEPGDSGSREGDGP